MTTPWISILGMLGFVVFLPLFIAACRGRRVGHAPCCQKCGYEPGRQLGDEAVCPECGWRGVLKPGVRRRSRTLIVGTAALLLAFLVLVAGSVLGPGVPRTVRDVYRWFPDRLVVVLIPTGNENAAEEAAERVAAANLSSASESRLIEHLLRLQADPTQPWRHSWSDALILALDAGRMTGPQTARYIRQSQEISLSVRSLVQTDATSQAYEFRLNGRSPTAPPRRGSSAIRDEALKQAWDRIPSAYTRRVRITGITIDGTPVETHLMDGASGWMPVGHGHGFLGQLPVPAQNKTDAWEVAIHADITVVNASGNVQAQWTATETSTVRFARPDEPIIQVIRDEQSTSDLLSQMTALRLDVEDTPDTSDGAFAGTTNIATLYLHALGPVPHPITGEIEIITPTGSRRFNQILLPNLASNQNVLIREAPMELSQSVSVRTRWSLREDDGVLAFWADLRKHDHVDIVLHSIPDRAIDLLQYDTVMDLSMRFNAVPVQPQDRRVRGVPIAVTPPAPTPGIPARRLEPHPASDEQTQPQPAPSPNSPPPDSPEP